MIHQRSSISRTVGTIAAWVRLVGIVQRCRSIDLSTVGAINSPGARLELTQIVVLALVQGITEFLPISSSGHLALVPSLVCWPDQGLLIDVAVHVGTLGAVTAYLWRDVWSILTGLARPRAGLDDSGVRLFFHLAVATVPVVIAGYLMHKYIGDGLRSMEVIAWATLGFGVVLYAADRTGLTVRRIDHMSWGVALAIGMTQILALIPGASRSGVTMTAARMLGYERREAARFSMLLSIPTIVAAGTLVGIEIVQSGDARLQADAAITAALAFVSALVTIFLMMGWLRRASFTPFVVYRIFLGGGLLAIVYLDIGLC